MRTGLSATLEAAQVAASRQPYLYLLFTSYDEGTTYNLSSNGSYGNRILLIDHSEEPYNEYAYIMLRDYDRALPTDLTGYWVEIGYGDVTGVGDEYAQTARLWVKHQQVVSAAGKLIIILELEGMWAKLKETKMMLGTAPYFNATYTTETPYDLITLFLSEADPAVTLAALGGQDDGIIDTYIPEFSVNEVEYFEDAASLIYEAIKMTKCFLRPKTGLEFEVRYPLESNAVDLTIYSEGTGVQKFYEYADRKNLVIPNHIYCVANQGADGLWTDKIIAEAVSQDSIDAYGDTPDIVLAPELDNATDAENRAEVVLARMGDEEPAGTLTIPHDCRIELYDYILVGDSRGFV